MAMDIKSILEKTKVEDKPIVSVLSKGSNSRLIAIGLGDGVVLKEHKAPGPTRMIVLKGELEYRAQGEVKVLSELDEFDIPLKEIHSVTGRGQTVFLLSVNN